MTPAAVATPAPGADSRARRRRQEAAGPTTYDFRRPIQLSREHSRHLQLAFDGFARQATTVFTSALRVICSVSLASIEQQAYSEYVDSLPPTTYLTLFTVDPMPGRGLLELPLGATMSCVDHLLGGPGAESQPSRPLTDIEGGVVGGFVSRLLSEMRYSLSPIVQLEPEKTGVEYSPQFAQLAGSADVMVVIALRPPHRRAARTAQHLPALQRPAPPPRSAAAPVPLSRAASGPSASARPPAGERPSTPCPSTWPPPPRHPPGPVVLTGLEVGDVLRLATRQRPARRVLRRPPSPTPRPVARAPPRRPDRGHRPEQHRRPPTTTPTRHLDPTSSDPTTGQHDSLATAAATACAGLLPVLRSRSPRAPRGPGPRAVAGFASPPRPRRPRGRRLRPARRPGRPELVTALAGSPLGGLDLGAAVQPAVDAARPALGVVAQRARSSSSGSSSTTSRPPSPASARRHRSTPRSWPARPARAARGADDVLASLGPVAEDQPAGVGAGVAQGSAQASRPACPASPRPTARPARRTPPPPLCP